MMPNRRTFLSLMGLFAIAVVADTAYSKGGHKKHLKEKKKGKKVTTCSEKHSEELKKCTNQEKCRSDVEVRFKKCVKTGIWEGNKKTLELEMR
jgi:hypothetical protein